MSMHRSVPPAAVAALAALTLWGTPRVSHAQAFGFGSPIALNTNAGSDFGLDRTPRIATDGAGNWVAVWWSEDDLGVTVGTDEDIFVSRSTDNGANWTFPEALNTNAATDTGDDAGAFVATDGAGTWVTVWLSTEDLGGGVDSDFDIFVSTSSDNGATWTAPDVINTYAIGDTGIEFSPTLVTNGAGTWILTWWSESTLGGTIGSDLDILISRSFDGGATWSGPDAVNSDAATDGVLDRDPSVAMDGSGNCVAVWASTNTLGGTIDSDTDIFVSRSSNFGATWTANVALNSNAATDIGINDAFPRIATDGAGNWVVTWSSTDTLGGTVGADGDIFFARSTNNGATWTTVAPLNSNATTDTGFDFTANIATDGLGDWLAVWVSGDTLGGTIGLDQDILGARSTDGGATWSPVAAIADNAATDSGADFLPLPVTDGMGYWLVTWWSDENLGGTIDSDEDIFVTGSSGLPVELTAYGLE